jgi:hypothetical protein
MTTPTVYEYLNSISDLLVALQTQHERIDLDLNLSAESTRYCCTLYGKVGSNNLHMGWGQSPAEAYDAAVAKRASRTRSETEERIMQRHLAQAEAEIAAVRASKGSS